MRVRLWRDWKEQAHFLFFPIIIIIDRRRRPIPITR